MYICIYIYIIRCVYIYVYISCIFIYIYIHTQGQYIHVRRAACNAMTAWKDLLAEKFGDDILVDASRLEVRFFSPLSIRRDLL